MVFICTLQPYKFNIWQAKRQISISFPLLNSVNKPTNKHLLEVILLFAHFQVLLGQLGQLNIDIDKIFFPFSMMKKKLRAYGSHSNQRCQRIFYKIFIGRHFPINIRLPLHAKFAAIYFGCVGPAREIGKRYSHLNNPHTLIKTILQYCI